MTRVCLYTGFLKVLTAGYCVNSQVCLLSIAYLRMEIRAGVLSSGLAAPLWEGCGRQGIVIGLASACRCAASYVTCEKWCCFFNVVDT